MKSYLLLFVFFLLLSCGITGGGVVYWCGDHPCINKKEKKAYFKENMIVEIKRLKKDSYKKDSEIEKLMEQARINQKKKITSKKKLAKQAKLDEKRRLKEEEELSAKKGDKVIAYDDEPPIDTILGVEIFPVIHIKSQEKIYVSLEDIKDG